MKITNLVIGFLLPALLFSCKGKGGVDKTEAFEELKKPNLLIVLPDQNSYDMLGAYGNEQIITPNLAENLFDKIPVFSF